MPRLSLWRGEKTSDYRFIDKTVKEMFTVGSTDLLVHKYIGANNPENSKDATLPFYDKLDPTNIQDLLFLENRDKKYDPNIYRIRGHYNVQNLDFDLSQFGLFLSSDIIFVTVHYNDMIDLLGRKLMVGDVFELPHLTDYHPLNDTIPIGLRRYYQVTDANYASEGFSSTWYPHLWRIKCEPLTDSQEFANILHQPIEKDNYMGVWNPNTVYEPGYTVSYGDKIYTPTQQVPAGTSPLDLTYWSLSAQQNIADIIGRYKKNLAINEEVLEEARRQLPKIGYDRSQLYVLPTFEDGRPAPPINIVTSRNTPIWPTGKIVRITDSNFPVSSSAIRVTRELLPLMRTLAAEAGMTVNIDNYVTMSLYSTEAAPDLTDGGSGLVSPPLVLTATPLVPGPYGTADNTYSTADSYPEFVLTSSGNTVNSSTISVLDIPSDLTPGLLVQANVYVPAGAILAGFPDNTRVLSINTLLNTITVSNSSLRSIPAGAAINISSDFTGVASDEMDYRADADPRFQFIRRVTPRGFGYITGYASGNDEAPNGEPMGAGIVFPVNPRTGDYFLRLDYLPQRLFRFDGQLWVEISKNVRNDPGFDAASDQSQLSSFINETGRTSVSQGGTVPVRQSLSQALKIQPD